MSAGKDLKAAIYAFPQHADRASSAWTIGISVVRRMRRIAAARASGVPDSVRNPALAALKISLAALCVTSTPGLLSFTGRCAAYPSLVHVSQYVYFALSSRDITAADIEARLGLKPDEITVRGSRTAGPRPVPVLHSWKIVCREPGLCIDEQIDRVLERLAPHAEAVAALARRLDAEDPQGPSAVLEVVRYFNREPGPQGQPASAGGQPESQDLLGWHLGRDVLDFLHRTGAVLDIDEYDMTPDCAGE